MVKKVILVVVILFLFSAGSVYFYNTFKPQTKSSIAPSPTINTTQLSELTDEWRTYISPEWGFSINHPFDVKAELKQDGVHFLKLGPSQSTGTELFDGLSLLVYSAELPDLKFDKFVQLEHLKIKNEPAYETVSDLKSTQVANFSGYNFTATGLGTSTTYFLKTDSNKFIKITDMTVEPEKAGRDFHKTVKQMLNTLQINSPNPSGDATESTAVNAAKEYAAGDLNTPSSEITVNSVKKKDWNNSCLGLEQEGEICAQIIIPGYEIAIQANGKERIYRTNADGSIIKIQK